jgi:hypothetical protein
MTAKAASTRNKGDIKEQIACQMQPRNPADPGEPRSTPIAAGGTFAANRAADGTRLP